MRDLNFFEPYQVKSKSKVSMNVYLYISIGIVAAIILSSLISNVIRLTIIDKSIAGYTEKLEAPDIQKELKEAENVSKQIDVLSQYNIALNDISKAVYKRNNVSDELLNNVSSTIPSEISFKELEITNNTLTIEGTTTNRTSVAELQHNLSQLSNMQDVHVNKIDNEKTVEGEYSFDIKCVLKDVE